GVKSPGNLAYLSQIRYTRTTSPAAVSTAGVLATTELRKGSQVVQGRRQGGVSTPRGRHRREEGAARGARPETGLPHDQDPPQRHDRQRPMRERRGRGPASRDRRADGREGPEGAPGVRHGNAEELEPSLQAQP